MSRLGWIIVVLISFCQGVLRAQDAPTISFEDAALDQTTFLTQFALNSNAVYNYRTVSDQAAWKIFEVSEKHFKNGIVRLMKKDEKIIGFFGLLRQKGKKGKEINILSHLFLSPDAIGQGYGKILFYEAMRVARETLQWEAILWESDPNAAWFYKKMGAKVVGENPCPLNPSYRAPVFVYGLK